MQNPMKWTTVTLYNAEHSPIKSWPLAEMLGTPAIRDAVAKGHDTLESPGVPAFYVFS